MSWHLDDTVWKPYASGALDPVAEASVEAHVAHCADCRAAAREYVAPSTADDVWAAVRSTIAAPVPSPARRAVAALLRPWGIRDDDLVVLAGVDSLLLPWSVAVGFAVVCACLVGLAGLSPATQDVVFLATAPLVPVLAVVAAYDALDPLRELMAATPYSTLRLALLRAAAALAVALPVTAAIGIVVPGLEDLAWVWLAPSFGLTLATLVLLTWWGAPIAGGTVCAVWVGVVLVVRSGGSVAALTGAAVQVACAGAGVLLTAALVVRTSSLRLQGGDR